jgi:hypothetical protein
MTEPAKNVCPECGMAYDWPSVDEHGQKYCCQACAHGAPCTCEQHQHGNERSEPFAPGEVEEIGIIPEPVK